MAVRAYASSMGLVGAPQQPKQSSRRELIVVPPDSVPFTAVGKLSDKLGVAPSALLEIVGIPERTGARRRQEGFLKPDEADRLLRVARIFEGAVRVFGTEEKAARWLNAVSPVMYGDSPLRLLDSDAGAQAVTEELVRIDFGDFA